jgi:integrase
MDSKYSISIYLDTRREKVKEAYPVRLRVYSAGKTRMFSTPFKLTDAEFESVWKTTKPRNENKVLRLKLQELENRANEVAAELKVFSFEQFEKRLFQKSGSREDIVCHYQEMIASLRENNQFGNASNYQLSLKSLLDFVQHRTGRKATKLLFSEITKDWLLKYESDMLNRLNRSRTTVSMYLRALRAIFNQAKQQGDISPEIYPFGKNQYQMPAVRGVKKALRKEDLRILMDAKAGTPEQEKARDFWFFSYACNGINIKDIALLRWENLQGSALTFYRAKTTNTARKDLKPITATLIGFSAEIIENYGSKHRNPKSLIFDIISDEMSKEQQFKTVKNFTRFMNQNLKKLAESAGLPAEISSYWARHSFATNAIRMGVSMEMVSEAVGHSNIRTTQGYFAGFEEDSKQELAKMIMDF